MARTPPLTTRTTAGRTRAPPILALNTPVKTSAPTTAPAVAQTRRPRSPLPKATVPATVSPGYRVVPMEMWALVDDAEQILLVAREKAVALGYLERLGGGS